MDLILSSGFLAFGAHTGFLAAVEEAGLGVDAICGTSSGAVTGALWASGMDARAIRDELFRRTPLRWASPRWAVWRGVMGLDRVVDELRRKLPPRFEDLSRPFGVGVVTERGHELVTSGSLPEAVAASCAIPWVFASIPLAALDGRVAWDGGAVDRTALGAWRRWRPDRPLALHLIDRSHGVDVETRLDGITLVRSPRSGASLWSLGPPEPAFERTRQVALSTLVRSEPDPRTVG